MAGFERFVRDARPRLARAYLAGHGVEGSADATAEALAWAWEHWDQIQAMDNPIGYLYRVGQSKQRVRKTPRLPAPAALGLPDVEPDLIPALLELPLRQRTVVWLVHGCQWQYREVGEALGISASAVGTHVTRALEHLRARLEVDADV